MPEFYFVHYSKLEQIARDCASKIEAYKKSHEIPAAFPLTVYGVPRGGVSAALAVAAYTPINLVPSAKQAIIIIDDLIDSGATKEKFKEAYPLKPFFVLIDKNELSEIERNAWIVFPWERSDTGAIEDNFVRILQFIGEDSTRGGLLETPARAAKAWKHWTNGYGKDPKEILKVFEDGAEKHDQMITVKDIPIYSHCEHHLAPIFGTVTISYIPDGKIVGLSKLSRLADIFARRLQVQERMTDQIADALHENLKPLGVGVVIKARHLCMESRGICQQGHHTITTALRGVMKDAPEVRSEFLRIAQ